MTCGKESLLHLYVAAAEVPGIGNKSAQLLIGQPAGGWLSALKDMKDKVQSVAPALPKLLPNVVAELTVPNRPSKQNGVGNLPAASCGNLASNDKGRELHKDHNGCAYIRPVDGVSTQMPASECSHDDDICSKEAAAESCQLSSELLTKLCVDDSSVSDDVCNQNPESSVRSDAIPSSIPDDHGSEPAAEDNSGSPHALGPSPTSSCGTERNRSSPENEEAQPNTDVKSQPVVAYPLKAIRNFSADVTDSPEIIFASSRKKRKPSKHGIYILSRISYAFIAP